MTADNSSSQYILISYAEYERLRTIEREFESLQKGLHKKLLIPNLKGSGEDQANSSDSEDQTDSNLLQSGSGSKRKLDEDQFIHKVAHLVTKKLNPLALARPVSSAWSNFDLSPPSTSVIGSADTTPPVHFDQKRMKNDANDSFGTNLLNVLL